MGARGIGASPTPDVGVCHPDGLSPAPHRRNPFPAQLHFPSHHRSPKAGVPVQDAGSTRRPPTTPSNRTTMPATSTPRWWTGGVGRRGAAAGAPSVLLFDAWELTSGRPGGHRATGLRWVLMSDRRNPKGDCDVLAPGRQRPPDPTRAQGGGSTCRWQRNPPAGKGRRRGRPPSRRAERLREGQRERQARSRGHRPRGWRGWRPRPSDPWRGPPPAAIRERGRWIDRWFGWREQAGGSEPGLARGSFGGRDWLRKRAARIRFERREIALRLTELAGPQDAAHDLSAFRFGEALWKPISSGDTAAPRCLRAWPSRSRRRSSSGSKPGLRATIALTLSAHRVGHSDDAGFGHGLVLHQNALDLEGTHHVAGRLDDVVGPTDEPEVAVVIASRQTAGQIPVPIHFPVPIGLISCARAAGP
jgi:hypothetical protein